MTSALTVSEDLTQEAALGFARLMVHVCGLYTYGESSSVSEYEGNELARSVAYVLCAGEQSRSLAEELSAPDVVACWTARRQELEARIPQVMELWRDVVMTMPGIRNIALRDTLASLEQLPAKYDTFFAAHVVPCDIDYPLSMPVSEELQGLDYVQAWLEQLYRETQFLSRFNTDEMVDYLKSWCPDHQGLLINLYEPIYEAWECGELVLQPK